MSIIRSFLDYLLEKWDWFIYYRSYKSINRIMNRSPGMGYLIELSIRDWREKLDLSPELLDATQTYFNSLQELKNVKLTTNDSNKN